MSHEIEEVNGVAQMAYAGDVPWHGLGKRVPNDLSPIQMLEAAGLDWSVNPVPAFANINNEQVPVGRSALVRSSDNAILDVITDDWEPCQNLEAFEFFNDFIAAGDMEMHTAGSLKDGQIVWALAKVKSSFELPGEDVVDAYLHFTNPHKYGKSIDIRFTPIRVVCNNTLTLSLSMKSKNMLKVSHRNKFNPDEAKEALGIAKQKLDSYESMARFLSTKRYTTESAEEYFKRIFPMITDNAEKQKELSRNAAEAMVIKDTQPGAEKGEGSMWQLFNTVTYMTDHVIGRSADNRLYSAWYGPNRNLKTSALEQAVKMAELA
jgi:phage/plasmid-like protein (TIGR03299 family)